MKIASGNIYQGTYNSNQFNGTVNNELIQSMAGNDIIISDIAIDILLWQRIWCCCIYEPSWGLDARMWEL